MLRLHLQRWYWRRKAHHPGLRALLHQPLDFLHQPFNQQRFVVLDLETTGLDPSQDEIVSIAWVVIEQARICLDQARLFYLTPTQSVGQSAVFHQLTDTDLQSAHTFDQVIPELISAVHHSTLVCHNVALDLGFLNRYLRQAGGAPLLIPAQDTLQQEYRRLQRHKDALQAGELRLGACRARYGLPALSAHDALTDALATAELFLAQQSGM